MISNEVREHVAGIKDLSVKAQLTHLIEAMALIESGLDVDPEQESFVLAFDRVVEGYIAANMAQRESISRLLDERRNLMSENAGLKKSLEYSQETVAYMKGDLRREAGQP